MRNYQYTKEEEEEMDAFANEWKKKNRGIKGPSAWREFKRKHPWAKRITADALRQKYTRMKRDQYWRAFAITHANCPQGHNVCHATPDNKPQSFQDLLHDIDNYVSRSTSTIPPNSPIPKSNASSPNPGSPHPNQPNSTASSPNAGSSKQDGGGVQIISFVPNQNQPNSIASSPNASSKPVIKDDVPVELDPNKMKKDPSSASGPAASGSGASNPAASGSASGNATSGNDASGPSSSGNATSGNGASASGSSNNATSNDESKKDGGQSS